MRTSQRITARPRTLAYLGFSTLPSNFANGIQIVAMCEGFQHCGVEAELHATKNPEWPLTGQALFSHYGVRTPFALKWHDLPSGKWTARSQVFAASLRESSKHDLCFTRKAVAAVACAIRSHPCILEVHDPAVGRLDREMVRIVVQSPYVRFVAISGALKALLVDEWRVSSSRVLVEHDACREPAMTGAATQRPSPARPHGLRVMYTGSFYPGRGVDMVIKLAQTHPELDFVVVGATTDHPGPSMESQPPNLTVIHRVRPAEVEGYLADCDILLMPYQREVSVSGGGNTAGFCSPLKLFEYLAARKPIIASRLRPFREVLRDGVNCLMVSPGDLGQWSAALDRLAACPSLRDHIANGAAATARVHTWPARADRILDWCTS